MMKNSTQTLVWFIVLASSVLVIYALKDWLWMAIFYVLWVVLDIVFNSESGNFVLRAVILNGIVVCLAVSYIYVIKRSDNKIRIRQIYAIIGLFVLSVYVFSEYQTHQEKLVIRDICIQWDQAITQKDYGTAYELMSPDYQQTYALAQFISDNPGRICGQNPNSSWVSIPYPAAKKASIIRISMFTHEYFLEKVNHQWYFTGEHNVLDIVPVCWPPKC